MAGRAEERPAALVTGGTRGLGMAAARAMLQRGWDVWLVGRDPARMAQALEVLGAGKDRSGGTPADVTVDDEIQAAVEDHLEAYGRLDAVVCSAGTFRLAPLEQESPHRFRAVLEANLTGTFLTIRAALPVFYASSGGHILAVGSVAAKQAFPENGAYSASKFGLRGLMEVLAREANPRGITVSMIHPPAVDTPLWDGLEEEQLAAFDRSSFKDASEVGERIAELLSAPPAPFNDLDLF